MASQRLPASISTLVLGALHCHTLPAACIDNSYGNVWLHVLTSRYTHVLGAIWQCITSYMALCDCMYWPANVRRRSWEPFLPSLPHPSPHFPHCSWCNPSIFIINSGGFALNDLEKEKVNILKGALHELLKAVFKIYLAFFLFKI